MTEITDPEIAAYEREQAHKQALWQKIICLCDGRAYANRAAIYTEAEMRQIFGDAYVDKFEAA